MLKNQPFEIYCHLLSNYIKEVVLDINEIQQIRALDNRIMFGVGGGGDFISLEACIKDRV